MEEHQKRSQGIVGLGDIIKQNYFVIKLIVWGDRIISNFNEQNRYRSINKEIWWKFLTCHQQIMKLNVDLLSLHRRSQLETPLSIASPLHELHRVPNSSYVAPQTTNIWIFQNKKKTWRTEKHKDTHTNRKTNYRGPSNHHTDRTPGTVGQYALA